MLDLIARLSTFELIIYSTLLFTLLYQIVAYLGFAAVATHRHFGRLKKGDALPSVSVIVILQHNDAFFVEEGGLETLLNQQYGGQWEVVVVNDCGGIDLTSSLTMLATRYPNLRHTEIRTDSRFIHSRKIPILVGIKAALNPNILIADPTATPISDKWLSIMARGFIGSSVVLGYTGFEKGTNAMIRASRFMSSMRSLRAAISQHAYKGIFNNIGYTKEAFFQARGFTHLRLSLGEDDLFIQKLARTHDVSVIINPHCTMRQHAFGGLGWWWNEQRYRTYSFKFYPFRVKFTIFMELLVRVLFFAAVALSATIVSWQWAWTIGAGAFLLRMLVVWWSSLRVMRRLGEQGLMAGFLLYDLISPFTQTILAISRRVKVSKGVWR